ncbi:hypothetical protein [Swingsia samuiensis]|uniref:DUF4412 domain-containing protein n=1 Tax=Swingsia samuiensis TaxID=1293412 RepID=A0A4Y6UKV2_9PROT|nr:hypothetical protein [Swingsia samuiensis]QDH17268.1 hypothetical protein E3D00_06615 [Swingsia samuiensis]
MKLCSLRHSAKMLTAVLGGVVLAGGIAYADDHPRLAPTRDATVTYHLAASPNLPQGGDVKVYFSGSGDLMRVDAPDGRGITILDRPKQLVTLIMVPNKMFAHIRPDHGLHNPFMLDLDMKYTPAGKATIANIACDQWNIETPHGKASACVTEDGIILAEKGVDADGAQGSIQAVNVSYADIPDVMFQAPAGFHEIVPRTKVKKTHMQADQANGTTATPAPVPGAAAGDGTATRGGAPLNQTLPGAPQDTTQPSVANDSVGDGTVTTPDQPSASQ